MNIGTATSEENPTHVYFGTRGFWITYTIIVLFCHFLLLSMPFFSTALAWTVTCVFHSAFTYIMLHNTKGTPFGTPEQGKARTQTTWEQIDCGQQFTPTRKFLTIVPIVLFFLASFYTKYDTVHFIFNLGALGLGVIPKLPQLHGVRIFGINKWYF
ncbi:ORM1-like protein,ORM1-like protein 2,ORM1-like protein 3,ORM1-like protein 1 [Mytilus coruscus]|uniref:ORM1-like protein,ORM1-like protein 2,ORM1-like protein 3,ORM1-like protein 1 n=2 Tax=Mytilus TaxID=6548 RepID=A0A6J8DTE6_MYTCO|nr:ORM1-like protein,ORM1-like protein 2,ORM1-like protein 3,ORM1-like protein 1 [Mytilus coruscus]